MVFKNAAADKGERDDPENYDVWISETGTRRDRLQAANEYVEVNGSGYHGENQKEQYHSHGYQSLPSVQVEWGPPFFSQKQGASPFLDAYTNLPEVSARFHQPESFLCFIKTENSINHRMKLMERNGRIHGGKHFARADKDPLDAYRIH